MDGSHPRHVWRGSDEWHNPAVTVVVPLLGAFTYWFTDLRDDSEGHYNPREHRGCIPCHVDNCEADSE